MPKVTQLLNDGELGPRMHPLGLLGLLGSWQDTCAPALALSRASLL